MSNVFIFDIDSSKLTAEGYAMLQSLYSRSHKSVLENIKVVEERGSDKFLDDYLINYNHKSIADCATTTIFIENISFLATKVVQDNMLYNGQESSSRYLNYNNNQVYINNEITTMLMTFYKNSYTDTYDHILNQIGDEKAAKTLTFDVLRGFLPLGCKTQLSWNTTLRQAYDNTLRMRTHPLMEVRDIGHNIFSELKAKYQHSFTYKTTPEQLNYLEELALNCSFDKVIPRYDNHNHLNFSNLNMSDLKDNLELLISRPRGTEVSKYFNKFGTIDIFYTLDYGSFRDLQRHRNGYQNLPLVNGKYGFNTDYLEFLPEYLKYEAYILLDTVYDLIKKSDFWSDINKQYLYPMITNVKCKYTCTLPQLIYILELRSQETVHFSLRKLVLELIKEFKKEFPNFNLYVNESDYKTISIKRGYQDIIKKTTNS